MEYKDCNGTRLRKMFVSSLCGTTFIVQSAVLWWAFSLVLSLSSYVTGVIKLGMGHPPSGKACSFVRLGARMENWIRQLSQRSPGSVKKASCLPLSLPPPYLGAVRPVKGVARSSQVERLPGWAPSQRSQRSDAAQFSGTWALVYSSPRLYLSSCPYDIIRL